MADAHWCNILKSRFQLSTKQYTSSVLFFLLPKQPSLVPTSLRQNSLRYMSSRLVRREVFRFEGTSLCCKAILRDHFSTCLFILISVQLEVYLVKRLSSLLI